MRQINIDHLYNIVSSRFVFPMITIENNFSLWHGITNTLRLCFLYGVC